MYYISTKDRFQPALNERQTIRIICRLWNTDFEHILDRLAPVLWILTEEQHLNCAKY